MNLPIYASSFYIHKIDAANGRRLIVPERFASKWEADQWLRVPRGKVFGLRPGYEGFRTGPGALILATPGLALVPHIPEGEAVVDQILHG